MAGVRARVSDELLSVQDADTLHLMLHARDAHWQTPITEAPHLFGRPLCSDPCIRRARRPLIMMMRSLVTVRLSKPARDFKQWPA